MEGKCTTCRITQMGAYNFEKNDILYAIGAIQMKHYPVLFL